VRPARRAPDSNGRDPASAAIRLKRRFNLGASRPDRPDFAHGLAALDCTMEYPVQAKYRWTPAMEFGVQGFGELGKWDDWASSDQQSHRLGPALFGKLPLTAHQAIAYNVAWLFGASKAAPDNTFRMQVEYEF
jgi:hypothetical protein